MGSSELLMYLLKVMTIQGVFFLLYHLFLKNKTTYALNRAYLIGTLFIAFVVPFLEIPVSEKSIPIITSEVDVFEWNDESVAISETALDHTTSVDPPQKIDYGAIILLIYLVLTITLIIRSMFHLLVLQKLKKQSVYVEKKWFKLFKTSQVHPFSFLSNIFIPNRIFGTNSFDQILEHECEHVRQRHSIDRLLIDFVVALFWFNPFMYLYRRALIEIHEYQADAAVLKKYPDPIGYQEVLYSQLKTSPYSGLVSHFNFSTIKKRIVMINKQKNKRAAWAYLLAAPVTFFVILAFSNKKIDESIVTPESEPETIETIESPAEDPSISTEVSDPTEASDKTEVLKTNQDRFIPSILPLKDVKKPRVTSGFGIRHDPFDKKEKMHKGIDFGIPEGTVVISTADGIIHEAKYHDKYGYYVLIEHGEDYMTRYSQLSELKVERGDRVKRSEEIALSGSTGRSTGPHLHYEVIEVGVGHKNPVDYIKDHKLSVGAVIDHHSHEEERETIERIAAEEMAIAKHQERVALEEQAQALELERKLVQEEMRAVEEEREMAETERRVIQKEREKMEAEMRVIEMKREKEEQALGILIQRERKAFLDPEEMTDDPIYILDGKEIDKKEINDIDLNLIESVEVSKGKSALKRYGSKAEGGVIEIETKKKEKDKVKIRKVKRDESDNNRNPLSRLFRVFERVKERIVSQVETQTKEKIRRSVTIKESLNDSKASD